MKRRPPAVAGAATEWAMAYATLDDLKTLLGADYGPLTDRQAFTTANDTVGQEIVDAAAGLFDGYVAKRYAVPVAVAGDTTLAAAVKFHVLRLAQKIAWENCPPRRTVPPRVEEAYKATIEWLKTVASGGVSLPGASEIAAATADGAGATAIGHTRITTEDDMEDL
jgi:phage gp36-like protein